MTCRHKWAEGDDLCQNLCGLHWLEFVRQTQQCVHRFNSFHICEFCHCSELFLEWVDEMTKLMKSRADLLAEMDASREKETFTVPPLVGVL